MSSNVLFDQQKPGPPAANPRGPNILRYVLAVAVAGIIITGCSLAFWGTTTVAGFVNGVTGGGEENYSHYDKLGYNSFPVISPADKKECFRRGWHASPTSDPAGRPLGTVCFKPQEGN